ncbi:hypothetical protein TI04_04660 [Achromatium sp. WMS2]|nr:hypothetical protein TI04_04660 [Achromatium sp. WMS2]
MSYQALARKWRPRCFADLVGQKHVVRALENAIIKDRLHHAYLFAGTRGVGKTTVARIFAKCLNCEQGITATPCGVCTACKEIDEGRFIDLLEVDAASRTKVDQTRELLDNVPYAPTRGRYKVYLIDEVHMFSNSSFNALLKTLEEPPDHVKFLLATTDPQKLPITVLSRCLQFNLKRLLAEEISSQLEHILKSEAIPYDLNAINPLAKAADGSLRDALSLLDQAIVFGNGRVLDTEVRSMLGTMAHDLIFELAEALAADSPARLLEVVNTVSDHTPDFSGILSELLSLIHQLAVGQMLPELLASDPGQVSRKQKLAQDISPQDLQLYYQIGVLGQRDLKLAPDARVGLEMVLLRMLAFRPLEYAVEAQSPPRVSSNVAPRSNFGTNLGSKVTPKPLPVSQVPPLVIPGAPVPEAPVMPPVATPSLPKTTVAVGLKTLTSNEDWHNLAGSLDIDGRSLVLARNCVFKSWDGKVLCLHLDSNMAVMRSKNAEDKLLQALQNYFGTKLKLEISSEKLESDTPAQREAKNKQQKQLEQQIAFSRDPFVQAIQEAFQGEIVASSVRNRVATEK